MQWIAHAVDIFFSAVYKRDVAVRKDGRCQFTVRTSENNLVHSVGRIEIPDAGSHDIACKLKHRAGNILGRVSVAAVDCKPVDSGDRTNKKIKQVEAMRTEV